MHVGSRHVPQEFDDVAVLNSDEADIGAEAFAPSAHQYHVGAVFEALNLPDSFALLSEMAEVVCAVDEKEGVIFFGDFLIENHVRRIRIHREESLSDHENGGIRVVPASLSEQLHHGVLVEVLELLDVFGGCIYTLLQAVVGELVQNHEVVLSDESLDHPVPSHPPRRVNEDVRVPVFLELLLELLVEPAYNIRNLLAPRVEGVPAELSPNSFAALMAASLAKGC